MKLKHYKKVVLSLFFSLLVLTSPAHAADAAAVAGGVALSGTISGIVDDMKGAVRDLIANLDDAISRNIFEARQAGLLLVNQLDVVGESLIGKTFDELNGAERKLFEDLNASIQRIEGLEERTAEDFKVILRETGAALSILPFASTIPLVTEYSPSYVRSGVAENVNFLKIRAAGILLGTGDPIMTIGDTPCDTAGTSESELTFNCPKDLFTTTNKVNPISGKLRVYHETGIVESIKRFFGFGEELIEKSYDVPLYVVPNHLGSYQLTTFRTEDVTESSNRSEGFNHRNNHCDGNREVSFPFAATSGWKIVANSVKAPCKSSSKSTCHGIRNKTVDGFAVACKIANSGDCIKVLGKKVAKDGRGSCWGTASWTETKTSPQRVNHNAGEGNIEWGKDVAIDIPANSDAIRLTVNTISGERIVLTSADNDPNHWFSVAANYAAQTVSINPKTLDQALK